MTFRKSDPSGLVFSHDFSRTTPIEERTAAKHLIDDSTGTINIDLGVVVPVSNDLRSQKTYRATAEAQLSAIRGHDVRQPEVDDDGLDVTVSTLLKHDVGWLEVMVDDTFCVQVLQSL